MTDHDTASGDTRTVRFHDYGEPADVLRLETIPVPGPGADRVRVAVQACGLNPADWALCRGLFAGDLPRGIGIDVSGTVEAVGEGVTDVGVGDLVFGTADWRGAPAAAADGKFTVPIAATFPLDDWRTALDVSLTGQARGKLILRP
jgi:NADPH:quinone reductase-like Zn-dependent oxidoreductase